MAVAVATAAEAAALAVAEACGINLRAANEQLLNFLQQTMTGSAHTRREMEGEREGDRGRVGKQKENVQQNVAVAFKSRYVKLQLWVSDSLCFLSRVRTHSPTAVTLPLSPPLPLSLCVCAP